MNTQPAPSASPDLSALLAAARALAPVFRERAAETEALRRLPEENVADLKAAGLFRVIQPERCDGWQMDFHAHLDVVQEVAAGCGSTGFHQAVCNLHAAGVVVVTAAGNSAIDHEHVVLAADDVEDHLARRVVAGDFEERLVAVASGVDDRVVVRPERVQGGCDLRVVGNTELEDVFAGDRRVQAGSIWWRCSAWPSGMRRCLSATARPIAWPIGHRAQSRRRHTRPRATSRS